MSAETSSEPDFYVPEYPDFDDDCKGVLEEWYELYDEVDRQFRINKSKPIFFSRVMEVGLLGQLYSSKGPASVLEGLTISVTLDFHTKDQLRKLGEKTGIHGCCRLWLDEEYYILCNFVKTNGRVCRITKLPVNSELRPTINWFIKKESWDKPMYPNPPEDPRLFLKTNWVHRVSTQGPTQSDNDPAEAGEDESNHEKEAETPGGSTENLIKRKDKNV